jgi:DNA-binding MurR/RpiR family transcriptional regulator
VERKKNDHFEAALIDAASLIVQSDNLIFIGSGSSGILAEYGARYFSSLGKFSMYVKDPYIPIHANYLQNSTTIALSVSGENRFTVSHLNELKQKGSNIISITNNKHCTIANMADINISYYVTEEWYKKSNITTQIPVVYILEETARKMQKLTEQSE